MTRPGAVVGTPAYMSPEQAAGSSETLTSSSDIYSLGSILYTILIGKRAYPDLDASRVLKNVRIGNFRPPREVKRNTPRPLEAVCLKAMSKEPNARYASARELADDIDRWLADEPVHSWSEPLTTRARRWMKRHRVTVASSVVGLIIATAGLGVILAVQRRANRQLTKANVNERNATAEAEKQFELAVSAIEKYHDDVATDFLLGQAEFRKLREGLLQAPQSFYADLTKQLEEKTEPSRVQRVSLYNAHIQLADLAENLANYQDSIHSYKKAEGIIGDLLNEYPNEQKFTEDRIKILNSLGFLHGISGQPKEAERLLQRAEILLVKMPAQEANNQKLDMLRAAVLRTQATLCSSQSRSDEASVCYENSIAIRRRLMNTEPEKHEYKKELASTLNDFGNLLSNRGKIDQAEAAMREGAELQENVVLKTPDEAFELYRLASIYTNLAYILQETNRNAEAVHFYEQSEPLFRKLATEGANIVVFQNGLAATLNNLGLLHAGMEDFNEAERYYREALLIKERLVADHPMSVEYRTSLAGGYSNFAGFQRLTGNLDESLEGFTRSIETLTDVLEEHPNDSTARFFWRQAHINRARTFRKIDQHLDAAADFKAAAQYESNPAQLRPLINQQAQSLALAGRHQEACTLVEKLEQEARSEKDHFDIAFIYALTVTATEQDDAIDETTKMELLTKYTDRAAKTLRAMYATGDVPRSVFQNLLKQNEYLKSLHGRSEFEQLRQEFTD